MTCRLALLEKPGAKYGINDRPTVSSSPNRRAPQGKMVPYPERTERE